MKNWEILLATRMRCLVDYIRNRKDKRIDRLANQ